MSSPAHVQSSSIIRSFPSSKASRQVLLFIQRSVSSEGLIGDTAAFLYQPSHGCYQSSRTCNCPWCRWP
ncbi:hypothetical protein DTO282E5_1326 [Paecilomyces variotii]|nr:hypothetical protein DTO282E5_1326 [Paecilomyces variotii]